MSNSARRSDHPEARVDASRSRQGRHEELRILTVKNVQDVGGDVGLLLFGFHIFAKLNGRVNDISIVKEAAADAPDALRQPPGLLADRQQLAQRPARRI
jgi:hypothetical protein